MSNLAAMLPIEKIAAEHGQSMAVVIQACRVFFKSTSAEELTTLIQKDKHDWRQVAAISRQHRIRPVVYRALLVSELPEVIRRAIDAELKDLLRTELIKTTEALHITELFQKNGIEAFPYKGAIYSKEFFGEYGMRETGDIDLAINNRHLHKINELLVERGYTPEHKDFYTYLGHELYCTRNRGYNYIKKQGDSLFYVENHWGMLEDFNLVTDTISTFNLHEIKLLEDKNQKIFTLNKFEHFKAIYLHHTVQEGLTYLKTAIDLAQGLTVLGEPTSLCEKNTIEQLNKNHQLQELSNLCYKLFGIRSKTAEIKEEKIERLIKLPFLINRRVLKNKMGYSFYDYLSFHLNLLSARILFIDGPYAKSLFLIKAVGRIFKYDIDDFRFIKFPRKYITLYNLIRPFRKIFFPINPIKKIPTLD